MQTHVNGIIKTETGYGVKDFLHGELVELGGLSFSTYKDAVQALSNRVMPESFRPYLLAAEGLSPEFDTWNNLIFTGQVDGVYDHEQKAFKNASCLGIGAAGNVEFAYIAALDATHKSIQSMVKPI